MVTPRDERLPRARRILRPADFARIYRRRWSDSDGPLVLYSIPREASPSEPADARIGLSVSRRIGNAVVRNRWKRRLREAFRVVRPRLPAGNDYVLVVRSGLPLAGAAAAALVAESIVALAARVTSRPTYGRLPRSGGPAQKSPRRRGRTP